MKKISKVIIMSEQKELPIQAIGWFEQELDRMVEDKEQLVADYFNLTHGIEDGDNEAIRLANMIVNMQKKQLDRVDVQLIRWSALKLTEQQQEAVVYCQTQLHTLYQLQNLLEQGPPANMHLLQ